jgi:hypothetical protein
VVVLALACLRVCQELAVLSVREIMDGETALHIDLPAGAITGEIFVPHVLGPTPWII